MLKYIKENPKVLVPPALGFDSGVHAINDDELLVVSTDPCLGVPKEWFGWLLIHYAASDVALFGAKPEFCTITLLGSPSTKAKVFEDVMKQACKAADELDMAVVAGHTGTYGALSDLIGICTAYGKTTKNKLITPDGARPGDSIVCTKQFGLETVVNLALKKETLANDLFTATRTRVLRSQVDKQTCVKEASLLAQIEGVNAMHDATEGGLVEALNEMAESSGLGFTLDFDKLPISGEVQVLQKRYCLTQRELLSMSSAGTLLAAVSSRTVSHVLAELRKNFVDASLIGYFTESQQRVVKSRGEKTGFPIDAEDPYAKIVLS